MCRKSNPKMQIGVALFSHDYDVNFLNRLTDKQLKEIALADEDNAAYYDSLASFQEDVNMLEGILRPTSGKYVFFLNES